MPEQIARVQKVPDEAKGFDVNAPQEAQEVLEVDEWGFQMAIDQLREASCQDDVVAVLEALLHAKPTAGLLHSPDWHAALGPDAQPTELFSQGRAGLLAAELRQCWAALRQSGDAGVGAAEGDKPTPENKAAEEVMACDAPAGNDDSAEKGTDLAVEPPPPALGDKGVVLLERPGDAASQEVPLDEAALLLADVAEAIRQQDEAGVADDSAGAFWERASGSGQGEGSSCSTPPNCGAGDRKEGDDEEGEEVATQLRSKAYLTSMLLRARRMADARRDKGADSGHGGAAPERRPPSPPRSLSSSTSSPLPRSASASPASKGAAASSAPSRRAHRSEHSDQAVPGSSRWHWQPVTGRGSGELAEATPRGAVGRECWRAQRQEPDSRRDHPVTAAAPAAAEDVSAPLAPGCYGPSGYQPAPAPGDAGRRAASGWPGSPWHWPGPACPPPPPYPPRVLATSPPMAWVGPPAQRPDGCWSSPPPWRNRDPYADPYADLGTSRWHWASQPEIGSAALPSRSAELAPWAAGMQAAP